MMPVRRGRRVGISRRRRPDQNRLPGRRLPFEVVTSIRRTRTGRKIRRERHANRTRQTGRVFADNHSELRGIRQDVNHLGERKSFCRWPLVRRWQEVQLIRLFQGVNDPTLVIKLVEQQIDNSGPAAVLRLQA